MAGRVQDAAAPTLSCPSTIVSCACARKESWMISELCVGIIGYTVLPYCSIAGDACRRIKIS